MHIPDSILCVIVADGMSSVRGSPRQTGTILCVIVADGMSSVRGSLDKPEQYCV